MMCRVLYELTLNNQSAIFRDTYFLTKFDMVVRAYPHTSNSRICPSSSSTIYGTFSFVRLKLFLVIVRLEESLFFPSICNADPGTIGYRQIGTDEEEEEEEGKLESI